MILNFFRVYRKGIYENYRKISQSVVCCISYCIV